MADNVDITPGSGATVAADEIGGVKHQRVKVQHGADGSATDVSAASPLPVDDADSQVLLTAIDGHVDGIEGLLATIDADTGVLGATGDAAASAGGTGTLSAKLRLATSLLDAIKTAAEALDNAIAGSELQVDVVGALPAGTNNIGDVDVLSLPALPAGSNAIGKLAANSGVDIGDVDVTSIAAGSNAIGDVGLRPRVSGGLSMFRTLDLDETEEEIKASVGQVYGYYFYNAAASVRYLKFYNATAANVTVGTTTPVLTLPLPAGAAGHVPFPQGIAFSTAITVAATTGLADNDTGAPAANDVILNVFYT